jgi:hypothetical protein
MALAYITVFLHRSRDIAGLGAARGVGTALISSTPCPPVSRPRTPRRGAQLSQHSRSQRSDSAPDCRPQPVANLPSRPVSSGRIGEHKLLSLAI